MDEEIRKQPVHRLGVLMLHPVAGLIEMNHSGIVAQRGRLICQTTVEESIPVSTDDQCRAADAAGRRPGIWGEVPDTS